MSGSVDIDEAFARYEGRVRAYGLTWWTRDARVEDVLRHRPALLEFLAEKARRGRTVETKDVYWDLGLWRAERQGVHVSVIQALFPRPRSPVRSPFAVFLLGVPGSGKSTMLKPLARAFLEVAEDGQVSSRDADEVRALLPEYDAGLGSEVVQSEVVDITYDIARASLTPDQHLIIDMVGDPDWLSEEVDHFAGLGFSVVVLCADLPIALAEERAKQRALASGRFVSVAYLRSCDGRPRQALQQTLANGRPVDHWAVVDTSGSPGDLPRIVDGDGRFGRAGEPFTLSASTPP